MNAHQVIICGDFYTCNAKCNKITLISKFLKKLRHLNFSCVVIKVFLENLCFKCSSS